MLCPDADGTSCIPNSACEPRRKAVACQLAGERLRSGVRPMLWPAAVQPKQRAAPNRVDRDAEVTTEKGDENIVKSGT